MKVTLLTAGTLALLSMFGIAHAGGDPAAGKAKAAACAGCHGASGEGVKPNPPLAGLPEGKFVQAMKDYKSGKRANPVMKNFAAPLSDQDFANLAAYYASLKKK
ncbi:MAG TPA: c-type cytochrome [Burkholderiales bacterium]|jgi:cytochrome c553